MAHTWRWASPPEWDRFAQHSPCATPFHARGWCETYCAYSPRYQARALALELDTGRSVLLPLFLRSGVLRRGVFARAVSSRPGVYGGPLALEAALSSEDWSAFARAMPDLPLGAWECFGNALDPHAPAAEHLHTGRRTTHVVDLAALPDDALGSYESNCRRNVRKAEREGVRVQREERPEALREYYAMYVASQRRWGEDPERGYEERLFELLAARAGAELWTARTREGALAAGGWFLFSAAHVVYWHGSMHEEFSALRPANALHHTLIVEARRRGARCYDFNPSEDLDGVKQFKRSFGARELEFPTLRWRSAALARLERWLGRA
jgi:CelD/BcsL family acetyltransferase involved in cellulose biosynthesis